MQEQAIINVKTNKTLKEKKAFWLVRVITASVWAGKTAGETTRYKCQNRRSENRGVSLVAN